MLSADYGVDILFTAHIPLVILNPASRRRSPWHAGGVKEKAKAHNVAHKERFDPPTDEPGDAKPTGTGWVEEELEHPPKRDRPEAD